MVPNDIRNVVALQAMSRSCFLCRLKKMLKHFNPFQCSISGKSGLILTNGVREGPLWGVVFM